MHHNKNTEQHENLGLVQKSQQYDYICFKSPEIMIPKNSKVLHKYNVLQLFLCLLQKVYHYIWFAK